MYTKQQTILDELYKQQQQQQQPFNGPFPNR